MAIYFRHCLVILLSLTLAACGGGGGGGDANENNTATGNLWTWIAGSDTVDQTGVYGTQGSAAASNVPGARTKAMGWRDSSGNLWLFGGSGFDSSGTADRLNDLWRWDGTNWTWIAGSDTVNQSGVYGTQGTATATNVPGARTSGVNWTDANDNLWLFGGYGYDSNGTLGNLNDLWRWDGSNWTWIAGSNTVDQSGVYGTQGTASASNVPGARNKAVGWSDSNGNLWLFGGKGYGSGAALGYLNDLWRWDGSNWTWMAGSSVLGAKGTYGTQGTAATDNVPGARNGSIGWIDDSDTLWLFGGDGKDSNGSTGNLNDLWRWDGSNWTWVAGGNIVDQSGVYGTQGSAAASNVPGARTKAVAWRDNSGNLWLFGGNGLDSSGTADRLNDLWRWDGTNWTWIAGSDTVNQSGVYGTQGSAAASNEPGARTKAVAWVDASGRFWLFGGYGYDNAGTAGHTNDLWRIEP